MSVAKKISLLVLLLLLLMVSCVYFHVNEIIEEQEAEAGVISTPEPTKKVSDYIDSTLKAISEKFSSSDEKTTPSKIEVKEESTPLEQDESATKEIEVKEETPVDTQEEQETQKQEVVITSESTKAIKEEKSATNDEIQTSTNTETEVEKVAATVVEVESVEPIKSFESIQEEINTLVAKNRIIFKRLSTDVTTESLVTIEKIAELLKEYKDIKIEIGGHTDAKGDEEVNAYVSKHRALSVRKLLIKEGVSEDRLTAKGYGESQPLVDNDAQGYSIKNRRVEFKIIKD